MPFELSFPVPENILVKHVKLGVCFFTKDERRFVCRNALTGNEIDTRLIDVNRGWVLYTPKTGNRTMFYLFTVETADGLKKIGASSATEEDAKRKIRAKLGLGGDIKLNKIDSFPDAATATFEEFRASVVKKNSDDSQEAMQQHIDSPELNTPQE
jgi:hypothetical protein